MNASVLAFSQSREDLTHERFPRAKVIDQHTSIGSQNLRQRAKRQIPHTVRENVIDGLVKELAPAAMFSHCFANLHKDHRLAYEACMSSQRLRYFDIFCYSPTSCHAVNIAFHPHAYIDISEAIDAKRAPVKTKTSMATER